MASVTNQVSPAVKAVAVTPADGTVLTEGPCRSLYVGGAGNVAVLMANDPTTAVVFVGVIAGQILPLMVYGVQATDTTATNIVALY